MGRFYQQHEVPICFAIGVAITALGAGLLFGAGGAIVVAGAAVVAVAWTAL